MSPADRQELDAILREQARVREQLAALDRRVSAFDAHLATEEHEPPPLPNVAPSPLSPVAETVAERRAASNEPARRDDASLDESRPQSPPPAVTPPAAPAISVGAAPATEVPKTAPRPAPDAPPRREIPPAPKPAPKPAPAASTESIELKLGTYWLARIGIVILLTGFVFLGNFAYRHIVPLLGPWGKLGLLALGGVILTGLGTWLERGREATRNYGRVLLAGGAATFYYTAYGAHFVAALRVIESPLAGGALLLLLAGGFLWFAERRRSQPLALSVVLLSYYTAAINPIDSFALFSNLLLTAVAVFLVVRHRWVTISFVSLAATYGSYGFWRFHALAATGSGGAGEFGMALGFLVAYWLLFTVAVFVVHRETLPAVQRTAFLTANNGALFAYAAQHFSVHRPHAFWMFALGYGAVLLVLSLLALRRRRDEPAIDGAYLAQGLALVALGCAAKFSGPQLATIFAVESVVLLTLSRARHRWLYEIAAGLCGLAALGHALVAIADNPAYAFSLGGTVALILLFDAWWLKQIAGNLAEAKIDIRSLGYAVAGLVLTSVVLWKIVPDPWKPMAFAATALVCALSAQGVQLPEIALPGQVFLYAAVGMFFAREIGLPPEPAWSPLPLLLIALALTHWWQHQRALPLDLELRSVLQLASAFATTLTGAGWLSAVSRGIVDERLWITSGAALGALLYGAATRSWAIAIAGQIFTAISVQAFVESGISSHLASSRAALAPIVNLAATSLVLSRLKGGRFPALPNGATVAPLALIYRLGANLLLITWAFAYIDSEWRPVFFAVLAALYFLAGGWSRDQERSMTGLFHAALAIFLIAFQRDAAWRDLFAILIIPASLRFGHRLARESALPLLIRNVVVAVSLASVWLWLTRWVVHHDSTRGLTPAWALLALVVFVAGLVLRERVYRLGGFVLLALAVGRIFFVDVWQLETIYRILSFLVLGAVLLLLGYLYNRFADRIREWL